MNGSTRLRQSNTAAKARCGYCISDEHVSTECPFVTEEEVQRHNQRDAERLESSHTLDPVVRCCLCGTPVHDRQQAFRVADTHETICNNCGHDSI